MFSFKLLTLSLFLSVLGLGCGASYAPAVYTGFHRGGLSLQSAGLEGTRAAAVVAPGLHSTGSVVEAHDLVAAQRGSSHIRDRTHVPCIGGQLVSLPLSQQGGPKLLNFLIALLIYLKYF